MDFAALPPEINSARMYAGPGLGPMLAAAAAWHGLAADLHETAASYASVISGLTGGPWQGSASVSMASAATHYFAWMSATAAQAAQAGTQAQAAAGAYEAAFAMTVPPSVIAANRAALMALIATNVVGQNTPAIAATEALYAEMWAQDAAAMYGYAAASAAAATLTPFTPPPPVTHPTGPLAGTRAQTVMSKASRVISAVPHALQRLASPDPTNHPLYYLVDIVANIGVVAASASSVLSSCMATIGTMGGLANGPAPVAGAPATAAPGGLPSVAGVAGSAGLGVGAGAASAGLGRATSIGPLSVPPSWTTSSATSPMALALGSTPFTAPPSSGPPGVPAMPITGLAANANGNGNVVPKYGFRPTVVIRTPAAG
ncbi:hypothetical protein A5747_04170 [Mycobacterium sp. IS-836]|uniref:PPE family protein n=1 Tax=Mycobacterium sp. IS-836 TaxID=1834160 RepID=UPI00096FC5E7|nr:PPE family protein [Mycobacterium sp. IS-836]OMC57269.1 hypothetical protein A5747_04170 [Mycobacterium sp. IS-836]